MLKSQLLELFAIGPEHPDHRRHDPISAISGGIGLVGNVVGGITQAGAAKRAAALQYQASQDAANRVGAAVGQANAPIAAATSNAQDLATAGANRVLDTAGAAKAGMDEQTRNANALLDPYSTTGQTATTALNNGLAAGGDFNKMPTLADLQIDPGYAFRQQQGELALQRSAAAHGGALGGGAAKDLANYSQGLASQEYQNAFNRFQQSTQNRFSNLMTASNAGQAAAGQQGGNLMGAAQYGGNVQMAGANTALGANEFAGQVGMQGAGQIGQNIMGGAATQANLLTGGANAQAAGIVGGANALAGGIAGGANAVTGALQTYNLLKNPALAAPNYKTLATLPSKPAPNPFTLTPYYDGSGKTYGARG